ncbi:MBL fold metallo-hydrolase [bacterium]|nr:MBL fold metallo-hydrolase [bacterium]
MRRLKLPAASGGESSICKDKDIWIRSLTPRQTAGNALAGRFIITAALISLFICMPAGIRAAGTGDFPEIRLSDRILILKHAPWAETMTVIDAGPGLIVVDTWGSPSAALKAGSRIDSIFHKSVKWVINTHHHWDHTFGNQAFPGADFIGHKNCKLDMEADYQDPEIRKTQLEAGVKLAEQASTRRYMTAVLEESSGKDFRLCPTNRFCSDRDTLRAGELSLLFYHTPGIHTRSNITVFIPELGLLFARREFAGSGPFALESGADPEMIARVLKDILASGTHILYLIPGHGDPVANPGLKEAIRYLEGL